ncbi:MAG: GNAT family N-acetyltransferase [Nocardioides sp.]
MLTTDRGIRVLGPADLTDFLALTALDPVVNVFAEHRARTTNLDPRWLGGEVWGHYDDAGRLTAACHVGANLVPVACDDEAATAFATRALSRPRTVSTIVGHHEAVETFWGVLGARWGGEARELRWPQPHLVIDGAVGVAAHPKVRRTVRSDLAALYPACVAMYEEEIGVSPEEAGGREMYRARVLQLVTRGWSFARFDGDRVVFKAEVACVSPSAAQVQGVWVPRDRRGEGLAALGLAAVVEAVRRDVAPVVSLYVNEWNTPARRVYERLGFRETARFSTIMFGPPAGTVGSHDTHARSCQGRRGAGRHLRHLRDPAPGQARGLRAADARRGPGPARGHLRLRRGRAAVRDRAPAPPDPHDRRLGVGGAAARGLPRQPEDGRRRGTEPQHPVQGRRLRTAAAPAPSDPDGTAGRPDPLTSARPGDASDRCPGTEHR